MSKVAVLVNKLASVFGFKRNRYKFKTHTEAWQEADKDSPVSRELLNDVKNMHNYPIRTKEDFRWFVLFNHVRSIDSKLNHSVESTFLQRIQENIRISAEKYLS
jgi:uncharacterized phage-associated protein